MMSRSSCRPCGRLVCAAVFWGLMALTLFPHPLHAESYTLEEPVTDSRPYQVESRLEVGGQHQTDTGDGKAQAWKLNVEARFHYSERRLSGTGRDAAALRSLRDYHQAGVQIEVDQNKVSSRLPDDRRQIVAQGRREGILYYSPEGAMTTDELQLLHSPGDSLAVLGLLPRTAVEVGETWQPDGWVAQMLTRVEAVLNNEMTCELESVQGGIAKVKFEGRVEGATFGAATTVNLSGHYLYHLGERYLTRLELEQQEQRSVGTVSPGMDVTAKVTFDRTPAESPGRLTDSVIEQIPLEPDAELMLLDFQSSWNVRFRFDRNWHLFHQTDKVAVLRLLEKGSHIAQCNVQPLRSAGAGKHTSESQFQEDIRKVLGDRLKSIVKAEQVKTDDERFLYRVTAVGEVSVPNGGESIPMTWIYYLCAGPSGQQVSFVFSVETPMLEQLANRDLGIITSLEFTE